MLEGAAYYEGLFPVLDVHSKIASNLYLEDYSYGLWEFMEWSFQRRFFRAANKPVAFTALYPRSFRAGHWKTLLDSLLQTYYKPNLFRFCPLHFELLPVNYKDSGEECNFFWLGFGIQEGVYSVFRCMVFKSEVPLLERNFELCCSIQCPAQLQNGENYFDKLERWPY